MNNLNLAVIGNCRISALVDKGGAMVWSCLPEPDGDPIFCNLLQPRDGADQGKFAIELEDCVEAEQAYAGHSAVLHTVLRDKNGGAVRIVDFAPRYRHHDRMFRAPMLVRRVEPIAGQPRIRVRLSPRFNYGASAPTVSLGSNHIRFIGPTMTLRLTTDAPLSYVSRSIPFNLTAPLSFMFGADEILAAPIGHAAAEAQRRTLDYWTDWVRSLSIPFEWQDAVIRAAITLKLCSFEETGAVLAALTTSIPEAPDSQRNWDYRYCWLRDAYFVVQALNQLCATKTMEGFIGYITNVAAADAAQALRPVYALADPGELLEMAVDSLKGYRGMGPVRRGNDAWRQVQNDTYGSVILAAAQMFFDQRMPQPGGRPLFEHLEKLGEQARLAAFTPDASLWEYRGRARVHTFSAAMCWAGCDRLAKIATRMGLTERARYWRAEARQIREQILAKAWDKERNTMVDGLEGGNIDASLLLLHEIGFLAADDPRFIGTVAAVEQRLRQGDQVFRYLDADDFGVPTTTFTVCSFWLVNALAAIGRREEARAMFERLLARRNHVGLLSEDLDPLSGELWGNFPQTYSMVGLIVCAARLSKSWEEAFWRG